MRTLDLNIFYREDWTKETGSTWAETLTIEPYIYESDGSGVRKYDTNVLIECTPEETQWLAEQFDANEYGDDFWVFADQVQMPSRRIKKILEGINLGRSKNPSIVVSDSSTMPY